MSSDDTTTLSFIDMVSEAIIQGCSRIKQLPCFLLWLFKITGISIRTIQRRLKSEKTDFTKLRKLVMAQEENDDNDDNLGDISCQINLKSNPKQNKPSLKGKIPGSKKKYVGNQLTVEFLKHYVVQGLNGIEEVNPSLLNAGSRLLELEKKVEPPKDSEMEDMIDLLRKSRSNLPQPPKV